MESTPAGLRRFDVSALARRYPSDARRDERVLATARVGVSCACFFAAFVGGSVALEHLTLAGWVLTTYVVESLIIFLVIDLSGGFGRIAPLIVHISDFASPRSGSA